MTPKHANNVMLACTYVIYVTPALG